MCNMFLMVIDLNFFLSRTGLEANICGDAKPKGIFVLDKERYLQVRYVAKRNQYIEGAFSIIITSYTEGNLLIMHHPSMSHVTIYFDC
jgi:hypothetical protein